jgi:hypothetical protein
MSGGGHIIIHAKILLVAITDPSVYTQLSLTDQATVNAIDAKDPMTRTQTDVNTLYGLLAVVTGC